MNSNETRTLWISVFAALAAVFLLYSYTQEKSDQLTKKFGAKQQVVVAKKDIREMETVTEDMLDIKEMPVDFVQPQVVKNPDDAVGLVALAPIKKDEQVLESKVIEPGPVTGLSLQVAPSKRAITIPIDEMRGVAKLIRPGDRIDLIAALDIGQGANQRREVKTLMEDVVVLATGLKVVNELPRLYQKTGKEEFITNIRDDTSFNTITIEAGPKEAQDLIYILSTSPGSLFMTLRHPSDHTKSQLPPSTINSVLGKVDVQVLQQQLTRQPASTPLPPPPADTGKKKKKGPFIDL